jgi:hypothetical protein
MAPGPIGRSDAGLQDHGWPETACDNSPVRRHALPHNRRLRRLLGAVLAVSLVSGCGNQAPSPSPAPSQTSSAAPATAPSTSPTATPQPAEVYAAIKQQVIDIRGLQPKRDIDPRVIDEAELRTRLEKAFDRENPPAIVQANERLLKGLRLIPAHASLTKMFIDLQSSQVAGFYDSDAKELFVVSRTGALGPTERVTFAHEFTHALQDQAYDLNHFDLQEVGEGDRGLARLSLIEGDATAVMTVWAQENLNLVELLKIGQDASDPKSLEILNGLPAVIRDGALFPYDAGYRFVLSLQATGGEAAVDDAFGDPPASTEQVMHVEKYEAREKPRAEALTEGIARRMGKDWKETLQDTIGEFQVGLWLREGTGQKEVADAAAAGWGGDRIALLEGPAEAWAIVWLTTWDTTNDATEFRSAAAQTLDRLGIRPATLAGATGASQPIVIASDDNSLELAETAAGLN